MPAPQPTELPQAQPMPELTLSEVVHVWQAASSVERRVWSYLMRREHGTSDSTATVRERCTLYGEVQFVGGVEGLVELATDLDGPLLARAGQAYAHALAQYLYQRVALVGEATRERETGAIRSFTVVDFWPAPLRGVEAIEDLREILAPHRAKYLSEFRALERMK